MNIKFVRVISTEDIILGIICILKLFKNMRVCKITKMVSVDRDEKKNKKLKSRISQC